MLKEAKMYQQDKINETHFIENQELIEDLSTLCAYAVPGTYSEFNYNVLKIKRRKEKKREVRRRKDQKREERRIKEKKG